MLCVGSSQTITVHYATADNSATVADADYVPASGTVTFAPGSTNQTVTVLVNGDTKFEPTESFFVNLDTPVNATIADSQGVGTIVNDDTQPTIAINDVSHNEGNSGTTSYDFTVSLSNPSSATITVHYATADNTATVADADYVPASGTVTFAPGTTSQTVTVLVNGDNKSEPDDIFFFNDTATTKISTLSLHDALPIFNDDTQPTITINDVSHNEGNSGTTS